VTSDVEPTLELRLPKRPVFAAFTLLLVFGVLEVGQRISDHRKLANRKGEWYSPALESASGVPLTQKPGGIVFRHHPHLIYVNKPSQNSSVGTINAQGFRGPDWPKARSAKRVIVLGGSTAFGYGAHADGDVFTFLLEKALRESGRAVEVLNAGVIGYDSTQELILLETELMPWAPDLVLVFDGFNDFYNSGLTPKDRDLHQYHFDEIEKILTRGGDLLACSAFLRSVGSRFEDRAPSAETHDFGIFYDHPGAVPRYRQNLRSIAAVTSHVLFVTQPELALRQGKLPASEQACLETKTPRGYTEFARQRYPRFAEAARAVAMETHSSYENAAYFDELPDEVFLDTVHLNRRGNEIVAERLAAAVGKLLD
jgi:lysophospholipase L1-like esterase